jgi:hypothetical protein
MTHRVNLYMRTCLKRASALFVVGLLMASSFSILINSTASALTPAPQQQYFTSASQEFGVPSNVLMALSYDESHWEAPAGMSSDGGYGVMDLRADQSSVVSGRDGSTVTPIQQPSNYYTLNAAAALLGEPTQKIETNMQQNIRGAAAVLAQDAKQLNGGQLPSTTNGWYDAVAAYSGNADKQSAEAFANDIYSTIKQGASEVMSNNQAMNLPAMADATPNPSDTSSLNLPTNITDSNVQPTASTPATTSTVPTLPANFTPECPSTLNCNFIPAAYGADSTTDATNYGNFDFANRPKDMKLDYIFIHDTEGSYNAVVDEFQNPSAYVSANYLIRSSDGQVTQMVPNEDVSWGVYDWYDNMHGINIENEGYAAQGATWYTPIMYQHLATLVRYLAAKYNIPLNRQHILGHDNIPVLQADDMVNQHWDPGPYWNWTYFMDLVHGETPQQASIDPGAARPAGFSLSPHVGDVVTIEPNFSTNQPAVTDCQTGTCAALPPQGANFVYLYTSPSTTSALLSDPYIHADGSAGTLADSDWGDKAPTGFQYVVAGTDGNWTAIWYAGQKAWFYNPIGTGATATVSVSMKVTPKPGIKSVAVYGAAYPDAAAYPAAIPYQTFSQLYTMSAGQEYTTTDQIMPNDYFYDNTWNYSTPDDHDIVVGNQKYLQIVINHRIGYVLACQVNVI